MSPTITFALPKGRVFEDIVRYMTARGIRCVFKERQLIAYDKELSIRWLLVKNSDVPIYVDNGTAMLGISGSDMLAEYNSPLCRLAALPFGGARMSLICRSDYDYDTLRLVSGVRVATKYPNTARLYFKQRGVEAALIELHGSLELAPLLGLAPYIVDIVQSGATIRAHNLQECATLFETKMVVIANNSLYKYNYAAVNKLLARLADNS